MSNIFYMKEGICFMRKGNKENIKKEFTIRERKDIINEEHNLLNKDENFYEREGLYVMKTKDVVLNEIIKELNYVEKIIVRIFSKTFVKVYKMGITFGFNNR